MKKPTQYMGICISKILHSSYCVKAQLNGRVSKKNMKGCVMNSLNERLLKKLENTFTYEFWVQPNNVHQIDKQSREERTNSNGKNYIIGPGHGDYEDEAGISVSVGINGITVFENMNKKIYAVLVHKSKIDYLTHIAVVYDDKVPHLFINGSFIKKVEQSPKKSVYPSGVIAGLPGLFFNGVIKGIRIWDYNRTEQQLKDNLNKRLSGSEEGLFAVWSTLTQEDIVTISTQTAIPDSKKNNQMEKSPKNNIQMEKPVKNENQMEKPAKNEIQIEKSPKNDIQIEKTTKNDNQGIEVSIIMPSFNKYPLNLLTLYSLERQTFNPSKMEVIFIDDASTDLTEQSLKDYNPPYHFNYIRSKTTLGRSKVRNLGIKESRGAILIFLDAEMITESDFVENHLKYHQSEQNVIVSGVMHSKAIYSCVFPEFDTKVLNRISNLTKNSLKQNLTEPFALIDKTDISTNAFKSLVVKTYPWFQAITENFGTDLDGFEFPWMAFLTGNVSLRKQLIEKAGYFDEEFVNYGYEDWELGYRLYKMGVKFFLGNDLGTYHQEHPVGKSKWMEAIGNYGLFTVKHYDVETLILGLELALFVDIVGMNNVLREYKLLVKTYPERFQAFQERFHAILETIILFLNVDIRHFNILGASGFSSEHIKEFSEDISNIKKLQKFSNLTKLLEKVINTSVNNLVRG
jgi:GT2 family glycosyltransferase